MKVLENRTLQKKRQTVMILFLCAVMLFSLAGCRFSPKLQEVLYESMDAPIDFSNDVKTVQNTENAEETTEDFTYQQQREEAEREITKEQDIAYEGGAAGSLQAGRNNPVEDGVLRRLENAVKGTAVDPDSSRSNEHDSKPAVTVPDDSGEHGNTADQTDPANDPENRRVEDDFGQDTEIPENVHRIAALGEMAAVVRMLGGTGSVTASDASYAQNPARQKIWNDAASVPVLMSANRYMSEEQFAALLETGPEAVIENDGSLFLTDDQIAVLRQEGVYYVAMPAFSGTEQIREIVRLTGKMIGTEEAKRLSEEFDSWANTQAKTVSRALSGVQTVGKYTVFLGEWDNNATYSISANGYTAMSGTGAAVTYLGGTGNVINAFTREGGVINTPSLYSVSKSTSAQYALPIVPLLHSTQASGPMADTFCPLDIFSINGAGLGSDTLPAVIAASPEIRKAIGQSPMWRVYGIVDSKDQHFYGRGFLDQSGIIVNSDITGEYDVFVNPKGAGSWWMGSAESIMEPAWVASVFYDVLGEERIREMITEFYTKFYGYPVREDEVTAILQGYGL